MKKALKILLFGFLTWLIPFIAGFFFFTPEGKLAIDKIFFKTIMILVAALFCNGLLILYLKQMTQNYIQESVIVGVAWLLLNWILDFVVLVPMAKMSASVYFCEIGLRYLIIPITSISMGYLITVVMQQTQNHNNGDTA